MVLVVAADGMPMAFICAWMYFEWLSVFVERVAVISVYSSP